MEVTEALDQAIYTTEITVMVVTDRANPIWQDGYSDFVIFPYSYRVIEWWPMWYL
jgi:hypothetical protein